MSNAKVSFTIEGVEHHLYFGMNATEIIAEKTMKMQQSGSNDPVKSFAYVVFGGMCNYADMKDEQRPDFETAFILSEQILSQGDEMQMSVFNAWYNSKPNEDLLKRLGVDKKKAEEEINQLIGTKSELLPSES